MCIIIDTDVCGLVLVEQPDEPAHSADFKSLRNKLFNNKSVRVIYGGRLFHELKRNQKAAEALRTLDNAGKTLRVDDAKLLERYPPILAANPKSKDYHNLALMLATDVRVVCTKDNDQIHDIKNRNIIDPPGHIYKKPSHNHLISLYCPLEKKCR